MAQPKRVIIDADPGIDDTAAILMALASDRLQVEGDYYCVRECLGGAVYGEYAAYSGGRGARGIFQVYQGRGQDADLS